MKKIILVLVVLLIAFCGYWFFLKEKTNHTTDAKTAPLEVRKHSVLFNTGIDSLLQAYFTIKDAFVNADTTLAKAASVKLILLADSSKLSELSNDTTGIYESAVMQMSDVKTNAESLLQQTSLTEMRQDFSMIGESIYPLLKTIFYEGKILYWQNCPMAFGEDKGANWISNTEEIMNPYLGKNHPEFKGTMLHCGEVKDSIKAH
ncbi:MAG: DUF3347 domain-containing protein [Ferruginibacter sp.]|nr:DUF3347 domain-containing protein [Ferruginibacter sp.]